MGSFFENSSRFSVRDSQFLNVNQSIVNHHHDAGTLTEVTPRNWYRTIPGGDINLLRDWGSVPGVGSVGKAIRLMEPPVGVSRLIGVKLIRSIYTIEITSPSLSHPGTKFTAVFYGGSDAEQAYKDDLSNYSALCHINIAKLFGITHCGAPALVFQSDMIPYGNFYEQCYSPIARLYLTYQLAVGERQAQAYFEQYKCGSLRKFWNLIRWPVWHLVWHAWIQPTSGHICFGPQAPCSISPLMVMPIDAVVTESSLQVPLELKHYKSEQSIIQHLDVHLNNKFFPWFLQCVDMSHRTTGTDLTNIPLSIGCVYLKHTNQVVAQIQHKQKFCISGWLHSLRSRDTPLRKLTSNGRTRCSADTFNGVAFCNITSSTFDPKDLCAAWLAQAGHVLHNLNVEFPEERYALCDGLHYILGCSENEVLPGMLATFSTQDYYLFLEPIKITKVNGVSHFSLHDPAFFWSLDSLGSVAIKQETLILLGLPSLSVSQVTRSQNHWGDNLSQDGSYHIVSEYLKLKGFDPFGLDYARSHGYPLFKIFDNVLDGGPDETRIFDSEHKATTQFQTRSVDPHTGSSFNSEQLPEDDIIYAHSENRQTFKSQQSQHKTSLAPLEPNTLDCLTQLPSQTHYHVAECTSQKRRHPRLRRNRSFSSFDRQEKINKPLPVRVCVALDQLIDDPTSGLAAADHLNYIILDHGQLNWKYMDCYLGIIDF